MLRPVIKGAASVRSRCFHGKLRPKAKPELQVSEGLEILVEQVRASRSERSELTGDGPAQCSRNAITMEQERRR